MEKEAERAGGKLKELGDIQNWAEVLERDLRVVETVSLLEFWFLISISLGWIGFGWLGVVIEGERGREGVDEGKGGCFYGGRGKGNVSF